MGEDVLDADDIQEMLTHHHIDHDHLEQTPLLFDLVSDIGEPFTVASLEHKVARELNSLTWIEFLFCREMVLVVLFCLCKSCLTAKVIVGDGPIFEYLDGMHHHAYLAAGITGLVQSIASNPLSFY